MRHLRNISALILLVLMQNVFAQTVGPHFSELRGMEDENGNTHLYYRVYYSSVDSLQYQSSSNHIYHWDLNNYSDSLFLYDAYSGNPIYSSGVSVTDFDFWNNNPSLYIVSEVHSSMCVDGDFRRYDDLFGFPTGILPSNVVIISPDNDSLVYGGGFSGIWKSTDGGWTFEYSHLSHNGSLASINPSNSDFYFVEYPGKLYKSTDEGLTVRLVDSGFVFNQEYFNIMNYDPDGVHIYNVYNGYSNTGSLRISDDNGNLGSWIEAYSSTNKIQFSADLSTSGNIYMADGSEILNSRDYGVTFDQFVTLDDDIIGLYKKSGSNILYAQTKYKIYEIIGSDSISVIKELPVVSVNEEPHNLQMSFKLHQNYPNPFNPVTSIQYAVGSLLDGKAGVQNITLKVYDVLGNEVATLVDEYKPAGSYEVSFNASALSSGVYFYSLKAGNYLEVKKMILTK